MAGYTRKDPFHDFHKKRMSQHAWDILWGAVITAAFGLMFIVLLFLTQT